MPLLTCQTLLSLCRCSGFFSVRLLTSPAESPSLCSGSPVATEASDLYWRLPARAALTPRGYPGEAARGPLLAPESRLVSVPSAPGSAEPQGLPRRGKWTARGWTGWSRGLREAALCPWLPAFPGWSRFYLGPAACADLACLGSKSPLREIKFHTD